MTGPPRTCEGCRVKPVAGKKTPYCYDCQPGGRQVPPPCRRCGSTVDYYSAGLCVRCHQYAPQKPGSCLDCYAWGATRHYHWLCQGCIGWRFRNPTVGACRACRRTVNIDAHGCCRLCRRQASTLRPPKRRLDLIGANRHGQQLSLTAVVGQRTGIRRPDQPSRARPVRPFQPVAHRQLLLFDPPRDLRRAGLDGLPEPNDHAFADFLDQAVRRYAARHGWGKDTRENACRGMRALAGLQDTPGAAITASEVAVLGQLRLPVRPLLDILAEARLLEDDRIPAIDRWFPTQLTGLPDPMADELRTWYQVLRVGSSTTPRSRPKAEITIRTRLAWALPTLTSWAAAGHSSLREITRDQVLAALPDQRTPRATLGAALRSIFGVLKSHKLIFTNPAAGTHTGRPEDRQPLPVNLDQLRDTLNSPDPDRAAVIALLAFHGLRAGQLRRLLLTDVHDGRLHLADRTILLAAPVRERITAWLNHRNRCWPQTANPHLFIHRTTATTTRPVGPRWIRLRLGLPAQAIREDRILHEAHATGGDVRRLCDLFGLSVPAATRYTATVDYPGLTQPDAEPAPDSAVGSKS